MPKKEPKYQPRANFELFSFRLRRACTDLDEIVEMLHLHEMDGCEVPFISEFLNKHLEGVENFAANAKQALYKNLQTSGNFIADATAKYLEGESGSGTGAGNGVNGTEE
ncbi:MAG TPA: hypothetical protein DCE55_29225 [Planctomycetaceae bacterium]|nr:hypothetical protein [Planctomycetaceae bacterium]|tara:strand:+ start:5102 stop:5428 length:327 start_codon:yes stop_codon:yes gene_type:complete